MSVAKKPRRAGGGKKVQEDLYTTTERGRSMVHWYFEERDGPSGKPLKEFRGKGRDQRQQLTESNEDPYLGGLSPTRIFAADTPNHKGFQEPHYQGRIGGYVRRAIAGLPPLEQNWIHYCYNPSTAKKREAMSHCSQGLWDEYSERYLGKGVHSRTLATAKIFFRIQFERAGHYSSFCRWSDARPPEFATTISRSMWARTYSRHWRGIRVVMLAVDAKALIDIVNTVESYRY